MNMENNNSEKMASDSNESTKDHALDYYVLKEPSDQNLLDLFRGEWSSHLPINSDLVAEPGLSNLFEDDRVIWAKEIFGDFINFQILELGPLEGGHTYMFQNFGAKKLWRLRPIQGLS